MSWSETISGSSRCGEWPAMGELHGLLLVDKPRGPTSHDVVEHVRRIVGLSQVGHAGTLDPFASGLLLVGIGGATRLLEYLQGQPKTYWVRMRLGIITDTFDVTGNVVETHDVNVSVEQVLEALRSFVGMYDQVPPAYSAKKYKGKKLYELARAGKIVRLPPRTVEIHSISEVRVELPHVEFVAVVSSGTYIRSLCMDIGYALGCGAVAVELKRTHSGRFSLANATRLEDLDSERTVAERLIPLEGILDFPKLHIRDAGAVFNGVQPKVDEVVAHDEFKKGDLIQIVCDGKLVAVAVAERSSKFIETLRRQGRNERVAKLKKVFKTVEREAGR